MTFALPLVLAATLADPRAPIVELVVAGELRPALAAADRALEAAPALGRAVGIDYLRADLLQRLGREREAAEAFAHAIGDTALAPWARLRLARAQHALGHPEVAAGLSATLLAEGAPGALARPALELLREALGGGGDCRLLRGIDRARFDAGSRRLFDLVVAECAARDGRIGEARAEAELLLDRENADALARDVAELLARVAQRPLDPEAARRLGLAAYAHREFELAVPWLRDALTGRSALDRHRWEIGFAHARSEFWLGSYEAAARRFVELAGETGLAARRAEALFQAGRAHELAGQAALALAAFQQAAAADPEGEWAAAALLSALRLEALGGDERAARTRLARLAARGEWRSALARGALFLAAGDLSRGRGNLAAGDLALAERSRAASAEEIAYWRGRAAELAGAPASAVGHYLDALDRDPFHPFTRLARARLQAGALRPVAEARAVELASSERPGDLRRAAWLLADEGERRALEARGRELLGAQAATALWLVWSPVAVGDWPIWRSEPLRPEDLLVGLGRFDEAPGAMLRHFPVSRPPLAFTGAALLAGTGATDRALAITEALFERRPRVVPFEWVSPELQRLLYPLPFAAVIRAEAGARHADPFLLAAVLREESRFDPEAVSPASARGLAQFVLPTARRVGAGIGLTSLQPSDLHRPRVAIALAASYLDELGTRFQGRPAVLAAAYNAGEEQAALWTRYCFTQSEEEYLSKVGFRETRAYVQRVLQSREAYAALYGSP
jgi:soluble lytic murein transglycosylase